jgi:hypothetical protein
MKKVTIPWLPYCLAVVLVFTYNDWILGYVLNPHMSANRASISELSATNQPYHLVFQMLDILAGILTLVCAGFMWRFTEHIASRRRILLLVLFLFIGLDSIVDASLPIACAPSVDPSCNFSLIGTSFVTRAHLIESNAAGTVIAIAPIVWWWLYSSGKHRHISIASIWLVTIEAGVGIAAVIVRLTHHTNYGGIQRIYQGALGLWVGLLVYTAITMHLEAKTMNLSKSRKSSSKPDGIDAAS